MPTIVNFAVAVLGPENEWVATWGCESPAIQQRIHLKVKQYSRHQSFQIMGAFVHQLIRMTPVAQLWKAAHGNAGIVVGGRQSPGQLRTRQFDGQPLIRNTNNLRFSPGPTPCHPIARWGQDESPGENLTPTREHDDPWGRALTVRRRFLDDRSTIVSPDLVPPGIWCFSVSSVGIDSGEMYPGNALFPLEPGHEGPILPVKRKLACSAATGQSVPLTTARHSCRERLLLGSRPVSVSDCVSASQMHPSDVCCKTELSDYLSRWTGRSMSYAVA